MSLRRKIVFGALATLGVLTAADAACAALWLSHMNPSPFVKAGIEAGTPSAAASSQHRYDISYSSEIIAGNDRDNPSGKTSTSVAFDDVWFAADGHVYNHALATTAMALSAAVNSESQYYGDAKGDVPYVEEALTALGFHDIDTSSFAKTSKTLDEVESLVKDEEDTVAYAFACKTLPAASDGNESCNGGPLLATAGEGGNADASDSSLPGADEAASWTLVFVGVRGTFGAEWLSDARVVDPYWSAATGDHTGYRLAELDVALALADYLESHELRRLEHQAAGVRPQPRWIRSRTCWHATCWTSPRKAPPWWRPRTCSPTPSRLRPRPAKHRPAMHGTTASTT